MSSAIDQYLDLQVYSRSGEFLTYLTQPLSYGYISRINEFGSGSVTMPLSVFERLSSVLRQRNYIIVSYLNLPIGFFYLESISMQPIDQDPANETVTLAGRNMMAALQQAIVYPRSFGDATSTERRWTDATPGQVMYDLMHESRVRGWDALRPSFTPQEDSAGVPWADVRDYSLRSGQTLWNVAKMHIGAGIDVSVTPDNLLHYHQNLGEDLSRKVFFRKGQNILSAHGELSVDALTNVVVAEGQFLLAEYSDDTSIADYGRVERYLQNTSAETKIELDATAQELIENFKAPFRSLRISVTADRYRPFIDYNLGDIVHINVADLFDDDYRILGIGLTVNDGRLIVALEIENIRHTVLERQHNAISNLANNTPDIIAHSSYNVRPANRKLRAQIVADLDEITNPVEGLLASVSGSGTLYIFDGTKWQPLN